MGSIVGGFYLGLEDSLARHKANQSQTGFWLDLLTRTLRLKPTCILLMGNSQVPGQHCAAPYSIGCATQWQLTAANSPKPITLQGSAELAGHIALHGYQNGLDWQLEANHNYAAPLYLLDACLLQPLSATLGKAIPCVPISLRSPLGTGLSFADCLNLGQRINQAVRDQYSNQRVAVIACHCPVAWPATRHVEGTNYQYDLLSKVIEHVDVPALHALHQSAVDSHARSALELLACTLMASAASYCQWLTSERGRNGIQINSNYLHSNNSPQLLSEHQESVVDSARRWTKSITQPRKQAWKD